MQIFLRSIGLAILLALCWSLWRIAETVLQGTALALYMPIFGVAAIILALTIVEWALQKYIAAKR